MVDTEKYSNRRRLAQETWQLAHQDLVSKEQQLDLVRKQYNESVIVESNAKTLLDNAALLERRALDGEINEAEDAINDANYAAEKP